MIDKDEPPKVLSFRILERFPNNFIQLSIDNEVVGMISLKDETQEKLWTTILHETQVRLLKKELTL